MVGETAKVIAPCMKLSRGVNKHFDASYETVIS
jgi:hypothetical protein